MPDYEITIRVPAEYGPKIAELSGWLQGDLAAGAPEATFDIREVGESGLTRAEKFETLWACINGDDPGVQMDFNGRPYGGLRAFSSAFVFVEAANPELHYKKWEDCTLDEQQVLLDLSAGHQFIKRIMELRPES